MATRKRRRKKKYVAMYVSEDYNNEVLLPLLAMFATCDDVFTEDDALADPKKAKIGLGRIYEEWKRCRTKLDPGFQHIPDERPQRWLPNAARAGHPARRRRVTG